MTIRSLIISFVAVTGISVSTAWAKPSEKEKSSRPNIVVIYTDDMDHEHLGCYGGTTPTPNIDSLANEGMRFSRFYVASPVCVPSRYNVIAGRYASRSLRQQESYPPGGPIIVGFEAGVLGEKTMPQVLQANGYSTGMVGKWHIGVDPDPEKVPIHSDPNDPKIKQILRKNYADSVKSVKTFGFDYVASLWGLNPGPGSRPLPEMFWLPFILQTHNMEWVTEGAVNFLEQQTPSKPFFLYIAPTLTHAPPATEALQTDPRTSSMGYLDEPPSTRPTRQEMREMTKGLEPKPAASVWLDANLGTIFKTLEKRGLADNTIIFLASDNGRNGKGAAYDGAARTILMARWKGRIPAGSTCNKLVSNIDLAPTILEIAGIKPPDDLVLDGKSILPALQDKAEYKRDSVFLEITTERAVVTDDGFKYIAVRFSPEIQKEIDKGVLYSHWGLPIEQSNTMGTDKNFPNYYDQDQLYDLNTDPQEQKNLAKDPKHSERLVSMRKLLRDYSSRLPHTFGEFTN